MTPTLQKLLEALRKLEDWFTFGVLLGVPYSQMKKIEYAHSKDPDRCKLEMLQFWLNSNLMPTWNKVIQALENIDQLYLASKVRHDHMFSTDEGRVLCL